MVNNYAAKFQLSHNHPTLDNEWFHIGNSAAVSIIPLGSSSDGGLAGRTAAAAGPGWSWLWLDLPAISRMLCSVAVSGVMLPTVPYFAGKNQL